MSGSKKRNEWVMYLHNKRDQTKKLRTDKIIKDAKDFVIKSLSNTQLKNKQDLQN